MNIQNTEQLKKIEEIKQEFFKYLGNCRISQSDDEGVGYSTKQINDMYVEVWNFFLPHLISSQQDKPLEMGFEELDYGDINRGEMQRLKDVAPSHDEIKRGTECVTLYGATEHGYLVEVAFPLDIIKDYLTQSKEGGKK